MEVPPSEADSNENDELVGSDHEQEEPSLDSDKKESRIAARRKRVKMKIEADRRLALGKDLTETETVNPEKTRISHKQITKSESRLEKLITDGTTLVTNVKVAGDSKEVTRRQDEDEAKKGRIERLEAEVTAGTERFDEIMHKWSDSRVKIVPQEILSLLQQQKTSCNAMVDEKDKLIGELQHELKTKDDQYVKNLKKQAGDIDLILERMEEQSRTLVKAYKEELEEIEKSYDKERRKLMESNKAERDKTTKERSEKEKSNLEDVQKRIDKNEEEVHHLRTRNAEEFNRIKIKLETDIQSLQQQIQQMKATFQLNAEKLEYNFQVLKKRDEENTVTISQQKRRLTRLQDTLNNLRGKLSKQEKGCKHEMQLLMDEYRKNTEQYRELLKKVKHFQTIDTRRFQDIWLMNEDKVREFAEEVQNADETIHRQQLGLEWMSPPPTESPMAKMIAEKPSAKLKDVNKATIYVSQIFSDSGNDTTATAELQVSDEASSSTQNKRYSVVLVKKVLELLCSECEFLIESKLLHLLTPLEQDEQTMMKLDSIFKAIGIKTEDQIHQLVSCFISKSSGSTEKEGVPDVTPSLIHPNEVLGSLCSYVDDKQRRSGTGTPSLSRGLTGTRGNFEGLLEEGFWQKMARDVLPDNHERMWGALLEGLDKYYTTLQARSTLIEETDGLRQQNTELRLLLHQYMHARINQELEVPPSLTLPLQDFISPAV